MRFEKFKGVVSAERIDRYMVATKGDKRRAMTLYRNNIHLSQELLGVISCFEVALRNAIDREMQSEFGADWLRDAVLQGGIYDTPKCKKTQQIISTVYHALLRDGSYTHSQLLSQMEFGIWKYMFSNPQFNAEHKILLRVFPNKPMSTKALNINNTYIFNELDKINSLRNRIAHHEPVCFTPRTYMADVSYALGKYQQILEMFRWLGIDGKDMLFGIDHVCKVCRKIR